MKAMGRVFASAALTIYSAALASRAKRPANLLWLSSFLIGPTAAMVGVAHHPGGEALHRGGIDGVQLGDDLVRRLHPAQREELAGDLFGAGAGAFHAHQQRDLQLGAARATSASLALPAMASISPAMTAEISAASFSPVPA